MKKLLLSTAALALLGGAAMAADMPTMEAAPIMAPVVSAFTWTGFYAGVDTGYTWGDVNGSGIGSDDFNADGWLLGGFVGFNWQWDNFVFGAEGDLEWTNIDGNGAGDTDLDVDWQGSLRARAGFAVEQFLLYGTAGLAFADFDGDASTAVDGGSGDGGDWGWTAGVGVDFAVTQNIFVRGEYRYADFGQVSSNAGENLDFDSHTVRVGAGFKF